MRGVELLADQTKNATRDYKPLSPTAWTLWDVVYGRRSYRKYVPAVLPAGSATGLDEVIAPGRLPGWMR